MKFARKTVKNSGSSLLARVSKISFYQIFFAKIRASLVCLLRDFAKLRLNETKALFTQCFFLAAVESSSINSAKGRQKFGSISSYRPVLRIRIDFNVKPDPAAYLNADPDPGNLTNADPNPGKPQKVGF